MDGAIGTPSGSANGKRIVLVHRLAGGRVYLDSDSCACHDPWTEEAALEVPDPPPADLNELCIRNCPVLIVERQGLFCYLRVSIERSRASPRKDKTQKSWG